MIRGMDAWATVAVGLGSALLGALAAGGVQAALAVWDHRTRRKVAARAFVGDITIARTAFELLVERRVWFRHDFCPALATWAEYRGDFIGSVSLGDWAEVDAFYSDLARSAAMVRPGQAATDRDVAVAEAHIEHARRARAVVMEHIGGDEAEQSELIRRAEVGTQQAD